MSAPLVAVDLTTGLITRDDASVRATPRVAEIIFILAKAAPGFVSAERISIKMSGWQKDVSPENINVQLCKARKVLAPLGCRIENSYGLGWRLAVGEPTSFVVNLPIRLRLPLQRVAAEKGGSLEEAAVEALSEALRESA